MCQEDKRSSQQLRARLEGVERQLKRDRESVARERAELAQREEEHAARTQQQHQAWILERQVASIYVRV